MAEEAENTICKGCGGTIEQSYCPACGEKAHVRLKGKDLVADFFSNTLTLEFPIFCTIKGLTLRPGETISDFIDGKRKAYYKPFQYYLLMLALYYVLYYLFGGATYDYMSDMGTSYSNMPDDPHMKRISAESKSFQMENMKLFMVFLIPIYAFFTWLFFRRSGRNFIEITVLTLYIHAHTLLLNSLLFILLIFMNPGQSLMITATTSIVYFCWVLLDFFKGGAATFFKGAVIYLIGFILFAIILGTISIIATLG